jgi:hypothetical protein
MVVFSGIRVPKNDHFMRKVRFRALFGHDFGMKKVTKTERIAEGDNIPIEWDFPFRS